MKGKDEQVQGEKESKMRDSLSNRRLTIPKGMRELISNKPYLGRVLHVKLGTTIDSPKQGARCSSFG